MTLKKLSLIIACFAIVLIGCPDPAGSGNNDNNGNNGNNGTAQKLTVGYLSNLMVDIGDAAALGISKRQVQRAEGRSARAVTDVEEIVEKNYLVKITTDISHGNVEWDESGLTNVTFKKKTTIDTTVWIPVFDEEGNPVYMTDEEGNPILDEDGEPIQEMQIIEDQTITQDEIPAQVNKLYVYNTYTYIQFVPDDTAAIPDTRPDDLGKPDNAGYYDYDKRDFYNDDFHQSFVIENSTGNIYSLADAVYIENIHNGLLKVKDSPYIYDCRIKDNDELEIFSLFQNTTVDVIDYYKDKYNNNFILNDTLAEKDSLNNTIYFKNHEYFVSSTGDVLYMQGIREYPNSSYSMITKMAYFVGGNGIGPLDGTISQVRLVREGLSLQEVSDDDDLQFSGFNGRTSLQDYFGWSQISHLKNKKLFMYGKLNSTDDKQYFCVINTDTAEFTIEIIFGGSYSEIIPMRFDTVVVDLYDENNPDRAMVYYYKIDYLSFQEGTHRLTDDAMKPNLVMLLEDVERSSKYGTWVVNTLNSRDEYTVVLKEVNGEKIPVAVKISEYVAEEQQVITLKPINR